MTIDRRQIIGALVAKTGVKLDEDDPAFLLVDLTLLMLDAERGEAAQQLATATEQFSDAATRNVDEVVAVTNEALSKFSERIKELKATVQQIEVAQAQQPGPSAQRLEPEKKPPSAMLWWLGPGLFFGGLLVGVALTMAIVK